MRAVLLDACRFDWTAISPAIFGALFQSVLEPAERRAQGAHYTTEKNILKVIEPLFLDDLRAEFQRLKRRKGHRRRTALEAFHQRTGQNEILRSGLRVRQLSDHRLPGIARIGNRTDPGIAPRRGQRNATGAGYRRPLTDQRRSVLRHRNRRVPGPHRRNRPVDDGPYHE